MVLHVGRYVRAEVEGTVDGLEFVDSTDFLDDGVEDAAVVLRGGVVPCSARMFEGRCGGWPGLGRWLAGMFVLIVGVVGVCLGGVVRRGVCRWFWCGGARLFVAG